MTNSETKQLIEMLNIEEFLIGIQDVAKKSVTWDRLPSSVLDECMEIAKIEDVIYVEGIGSIDSKILNC